MNAEYEALLDKWSRLPHHNQNRCVRDGIIDPTRWSKAPRKVLFLLREAYEKRRRQEGFDQRAKIRDEWGKPQGRTMKTLGNWAYAAHYGTSERIPPLTSEVKPQRAEACMAAAIVNLKKSGGETKSDKLKIIEFAEKDADLLRQQIEMIAPEIVICGGTWDVARKFIWPAEAEPVFPRAYKVGRMMVIDYWHPSNQFPKDLNYYALACILQQSGALS